MDGSTPEMQPALERLRASNESLHREVLDNGMICLVKADHSAPVVAIQIWVGTGSIHEGGNLGAGLSHYIEHMIFKGTPSRGPADITRQIDEAGGQINAYTSHDRTVFYADLPSRNWRVGLDVLSDAVMNASLPEDEWEREKDVILREFAMGYDSPQRMHGQLLYDTAYRVSPYRVPVIGYEEVFRTMNRDHLVRFFHEHYVPDNMIVVVVGDVQTAEVMAYLRDIFKDFQRRIRAPVILPSEPPQLTPRVGRRTGPYQVGRLHWAYHTVSVDHPDAAALDVLSNILGDGRSSILYQELRERRHLVHTIGAWSHTPAHGGLFGVSATYDPEKEQEVIAAIRESLEALRDRPFTSEQIAKAKRIQFMNELGALQTMSGQASSYGAGEYYAGNPRFGEFYLEQVAKIDDRRLHEVLNRHVLENFASIALLSPPVEASAAKASVAMDGELQSTRVRLSNGIPLIIREDRRLPFVNISVALGGGLLSENDSNNGITQLLADLLTRGTKTRTAAQIAEELESRSASLNGYSGRNSFGLNAHGFSEDFDLLLTVLADCLRNSTFPEEELAKQKRQQIAGLRQQREQPMYLAQESMRELLFPGHPYRLNTQGTEETVPRISRDDLLDYFNNHVTPDNIAISIVGDITPQDALDRMEAFFGDMTGASSRIREWEPATPSLPGHKVVNGPFEQAILLIGFPGVDLKDTRNEALNVLQRALSGLSSELALEVREKRGLVYFIGAFSMVGYQPGLFAFYAGTTADKLDEVQTLILEQIERIAENGLTPEEFERARAQLLAAHDMSLQNSSDVAQIAALNEMYGLGYEYHFDTPNRLKALTLDDIRAAASSILLRDKAAVSRLAPETH